MQNQYVNQTGTNKVVLVNPNDWTNGESLTTVGESQKLISDNVQEIFLKTSLVSPFLASARQELLFSTTQTSDSAINSALNAQISSMNVKYLTIMASPLTIPASQYMYSVGGEDIYKSLDQTEYADTDNDGYPNIDTGRIMGFSSSDVSSYVARDLFYSAFPRTNSMMFMASSFQYMIDDANSCQQI